MPLDALPPLPKDPLERIDLAIDCLTSLKCRALDRRMSETLMTISAAERTNKPTEDLVAEYLRLESEKQLLESGKHPSLLDMRAELIEFLAERTLNQWITQARTAGDQELEARALRCMDEFNMLRMDIDQSPASITESDDEDYGLVSAEE